jgi:hypothetical protein
LRPGSEKAARKNAPAGARSCSRRQRLGRPLGRRSAASPAGRSAACVAIPFGRSLSIAPHRLIDLESPGINAPVEVDCVAKAAASEKVNDHPMAGAMMANAHQGSIRREIIGAYWDLVLRTMQRSLQSAMSNSLASRKSRTLCSFPALRISASSRTEIASDPLRDCNPKALERNMPSSDLPLHPTTLPQPTERLRFKFLPEPSLRLAHEMLLFPSEELSIFLGQVHCHFSKLFNQARNSRNHQTMVVCSPCP